MSTELDAIRNSRPLDADHLHLWFRAYTGVSLARKAVCKGHSAPFDAIESKCLRRPQQQLELGSRGSGKSFGAALALHFMSRFHEGHGSRILGGSRDQSRQIYEALRTHILDGKGYMGGDGDTIAKLLDSKATYLNGSETSILAASSTSVRGPHIPTLMLDEIDEIDQDIRESSLGMCMNSKRGYSAFIGMTSTWHRPGGPMGELIAKATSPPKPGEPDKRFPMFTYCTFEVLERCPVERSGENLEGCPECPLFRWCHEDRFADPSRLPKAKLSDGHYSIDALIQKVNTASARVFEADYLCKGPKADGVWFTQFDKARNVGEEAEYDPALPVHISIDSGVFTGAVWFQVRESRNGHDVTVFCDYLSEGLSAESNALAILDVSRRHCEGGSRIISTDPAGGSRNAVGPSVLAEYARAGLRNVRRWPVRPVADSLALLESFVMSAANEPHLKIHPRCTRLIEAMQTYLRAGKAPQWQDHPKDPQHPAEDLVDALRGGLCEKFPDGRKQTSNVGGRHAGKLFY